MHTPPKLFTAVLIVCGFLLAGCIRVGPPGPWSWGGSIQCRLSEEMSPDEATEYIVLRLKENGFSEAVGQHAELRRDNTSLRVLEFSRHDMCVRWDTTTDREATTEREYYEVDALVRSILLEIDERPDDVPFG